MTHGYIIYDGPSQLDGTPIVCIATEGSQNHKTGPMIQTWILPRDVAPELAVTTGEDSAVCGSCSLRGIVTKLPNGEQVNRFRGCYVFVGQAPQKVWESFERGEYRFEPSNFEGRMIRMGSYGDPCAVPFEVWNRLRSNGHTGYTHQWRDQRFQAYRSLLMASVESLDDAALAHSMGWRTFRVAVTGELPAPGEFHCPASAEQGYRETCETCGACNGGKPERASVVIWPHGPPAAVKSFYRLVRGDTKHIEHRTSLNAVDVTVLDALKSGPKSAAEVGKLIGRGTQATATRLWHMRQMGIVRRIQRGVYEATATASLATCSVCGKNLERTVRHGDHHAFCSRKCANKHFQLERKAKYVKASPRNREPWTDDDLSFVRANYRKLTVKEIGEALGRGPTAVTPIIGKLGLCRRWKSEEDKFLREHCSKGYGNWVSCARQLNRTAVQIRSRVKRLGIANKKLKRPNEAELRRLHAKGLTTTQIGEAMGCSAWCITTNLRHLGLPANKRSEPKRMASLKASLLKKYGVPDVANARKVRQRRLRKETFAISVQSLASALEQQAERSAACQT